MDCEAELNAETLEIEKLNIGNQYFTGSNDVVVKDLFAAHEFYKVLTKEIENERK